MILRYNEETIEAISQCSQNVAARLKVLESTFCLATIKGIINIKFETLEDNTFANLEFQPTALDSVDLKVILATYDDLAGFTKEGRTMQRQSVDRNDPTWCS